MASASAVIGQIKAWSLLQKLGEGDAGEVFQVESVLDHKVAILKRPRRSSFASEHIRQATQIESEGRILRALDGLEMTYPKSTMNPILQVGVPNLLDQSPSGSEYSDRFFIVVEKAPGVDLNTISRFAKIGAPDLKPEIDAGDVFLSSIIKGGIFPRLLLLRSMIGTLALLERIHHRIYSLNNQESPGIIWNDVKPDHVFWDPNTRRLTLIDWGNAQFLEQDGYNKERRLSRNDDYAQFIQAFSRFLTDHDPELNSEIKWPNLRIATQPITELVGQFREELHKLLIAEFQILVEARQKERDILRAVYPMLEEHKQLLEIQQQIISLGEIPDYQGAENFCIQLATKLTSEGKLEDFTRLSELSCQIHADNPLKWQVLTQIAQIASLDSNPPKPLYISAIDGGLRDNWPSVLWNLLVITQTGSEPSWWEDLSSQIRQVGLGLDPAYQSPLTSLRRIAFTLQADIQKRQDVSEPASPIEVDASPVLMKVLREEIIPNWSEVEPNPPDSGLEYTDIERFMGELGDNWPQIKKILANSLEQPMTQVGWVMEAWNKKDFDTARLGLRRLLLLDPDRRRVLTADRAIHSAASWLMGIQSGPKTDQVLLDFITDVELSGRELRNQVGPAEWLDMILESFSQLRKGRKPGELIVEKPELLRDLPWLDVFQTRKYTPTQPAKPINLEREKSSQGIAALARGYRECSLGQGQPMLITDPLDTWAPEARGSSARTFTGFLPDQNDQLKQVALKVIRHDRIEYGLPLFREEIQILTILQDVAGITPLLECGFIRLGENQQLPPDHRPLNARNLSGIAQRFGLDQISSFMNSLEEKTHQGWLPYLAMPKMDNQQNLMWICDAGYTRGNFLPVEESLRIAIQICEIIQIAHNRNIVYRDHKLLHYYWLELYNGVFMIDWNVARYHPQGVSRAEIQFDLVQLGARALHHIFSGRVAPGALADGPNKVEEIESASNSYRVQWTYDDQRLPSSLKEILEQLLLGNYSSADRLREDFLLVYAQLFTENVPDEPG